MSRPLDLAPRTGSPSTEFDVEFFHDGRCGVCSKEVRLMRWLDRRSRIRFTDISADDFRPADGGPELDELMRRIHGRLPDGTWVEGVEVFRRAYAAAGFRWLMSITRLPLLRQILDAAYRAFASWRYRRRVKNGYCPLP